MGTLTAYGSDAITAWADIEQQIGTQFYPITDIGDDFAMHVTEVAELREAIRGIEASPAILDLAPIDVFPVAEWSHPDQGYRLNLGDIGTDDHVIVVFARQDNTDEVRIGGDLLPNVTVPIGFIDPGAEYTAARFMTMIHAVYREYSRQGDRGYYVDPAEKAAKLDAEREAARSNTVAARFRRRTMGANVPDSLDSF